jgi:diguanylate cyclase (GGDEF)-like protein
MSLQTALNELQVHKDTFGVLVIDLNRFKAINDRFGHATGDSALLEVANTLTGTLRPTDIVGRWGGDEFIAIVRHVTHETLSQLVERCRALIAETTFAGSDGARLSVTASIGAALALPDDTTERLIRRADDLMYERKTNRAVAKNGKTLRALLFNWTKKLLDESP